jgi:hypothetical protein
MKTIYVTMMIILAAAASAQQPAAPEGYWPEARAAEILKKVRTIRLAPDLSGLTVNEQAAVKELLAAGEIMQKLYEIQKHHQALGAFVELRKHNRQDLRDLYRLSKGPIATTLENKREPFVPVSPEVPGKNVYPIDATRAEIDAFLAKHPEMREGILGDRTIVRRETKNNLNLDIGTLNAFQIMFKTFYPGLMEWLRSRQLEADGTRFYSVPYALAYPDDILAVYTHLMRAAAYMDASDNEFSRYLRNRARDLLVNDYEAGDASWVTGRFNKLNAQIGAYETYDDALYGVKAFHSLSLLLKNQAATNELQKGLKGLQAIEDALPYENKKRVKEDISVGVYNVIADFGQARGTNTATILPNDPLFSRRYGRTILMRENILRNPEIFADDERVFRAAVADAHANDYTIEGKFQRTLWHEVGHYLGVERDKQGRTLDVALSEYADALEEMKADLVSLFALRRMNHPALRSIEAGGIRRVLQNVQPRADEPYASMQLVQFNWFVDKGLLKPDPKTARLTIDYAKYDEAVTSLLREVLKLQHEGDKAAAEAFFKRWSSWTPELHAKLAERIRAVQSARWTLVRYAALGE